MSIPFVAVVGSFVQDFTFATPAFPRPGQTVIGKFYTGPGGKGSNQAVAAARAGVTTAFVGAVGQDPFAQGARDFLAGEGIQHHLTAKPGHATGCAAILVDASGQNQIVVALGANDAITPADLDESVIRQAKVLVTQCEIDLPTTRHALEVARAAGVVTMLNTAPMRADFDPALLGLTDVLIPNETEFAALVNALPQFDRADFTDCELARLNEEELQSLCRKLGPKVVLVTLGARGCFLSTLERGVFFPAVSGIRVVDTTGAGDAFVGAFAAGYVDFAGDLAAAARFANVAAAISVTRPGTAPAVARRVEIEAWQARGIA